MALYIIVQATFTVPVSEGYEDDFARDSENFEGSPSYERLLGDLKLQLGTTDVVIDTVEFAVG